MNKGKKILFVRQGSRSFFETDLEILRKFSEVRDFDNYPPSISKWPSLISAVFDCDLVYIWFMGRHAVAPIFFGKIFKKKIILTAGGWDAANCPEIDYGLMRPGLIRPLFRWLMRLPDLVLGISHSNYSEILKNAMAPEEKTKWIYLGFKAAAGIPCGIKQKIILTIGEVTRNNLKRKGLEFFVRTAAYVPDAKFILIGRWAQDGAVDYLKSISSPNVIFTGFVPDEEKINYLRSATVYAQFSYHEAFGCAVAEAMLYGCVPVVTDRGSLPEVVGDAGYTISFDDAKAAAAAVIDALNHSEFGEKGRFRIQTYFSFENRAKSLQCLVESVYE